MAHHVSPCCGDEEFTDKIDIKGYEVYKCSMCKELFIEPIEDYEFNEAAKEARDEDRADEARDMGL